MNKSDIAKQIKQYEWTYIVRYKYHEDKSDFIDYYCFDSDDIPSDEKLKEHFYIEEGDEFEILYQWANDFNEDDVLSDGVIWLLQGKSDLDDIQYAKYNTLYISYIAYHVYGDERKQYQRDVLASVLKYMDLRKQNSMTKYIVLEIFRIFDIEKDSSLNLRKQIELILEPKANDEILSKLVKVDYVKAMRKHLDRLGEEYQLSEEKSKYRIGVIFLRFFYECTVWQPSFYNEDKTIRKYSEYMRLMAKYFGLDDEIKYREDKLKQYKPYGVARPLYSTIKAEHYDVWMTLP